jgi:hypothetical protein
VLGVLLVEAGSTVSGSPADRPGSFKQDSDLAVLANGEQETHRSLQAAPASTGPPGSHSPLRWRAGERPGGGSWRATVDGADSERVGAAARASLSYSHLPASLLDPPEEGGPGAESLPRSWQVAARAVARVRLSDRLLTAGLPEPPGKGGLTHLPRPAGSSQRLGAAASGSFQSRPPEAGKPRPQGESCLHQAPEYASGPVALPWAVDRRGGPPKPAQRQLP